MAASENQTRRLAVAAILTVLGLLSFLMPASAQEEPPAEVAPATEVEAEPAEEAQPQQIPLNLKDAKIEQVMKFLSENTGKVVIKSKEVQAQITIVSPQPVTPQRAVELICHALRLEGVEAVQRDDVIHLLPAKKVPEMGVETLLAEAEVPKAGMVRKIINIRFADVAEMEKLIAPMLPEGSKVVADPRSGRMVITAPADQLTGLEKVIAQLDVLEIKETQVRIFQLEHAVAEEIAPIIEAILQSAPAEGGPSEKGGAPPARKPSGKPSGKGPQGDVTVVPYKAANWIVVRAPAEKLAAAEQLIAQLDTEKPPDLELNVILVKHAETRQLARQLSELFRRRPQTKAIRDTVELQADERSNALIVLSSPDNFELIKQIVAELDTEESRQRETRSYKLQYADAEDVAEQLNDLYSGVQEPSYYGYFYYSYGRRGGETARTRFVAESRTNALVVIAAPTEFEQIEALIEELDQPISETEVSPRIYHIRNIDAKELTDSLNEIFGVEEAARTGGYYYYSRMRAKERGVGRLYGKVRFVHEPSTNSVIVITNNKENLPIIEDLIEELDRTIPEYANTMVYELDNANATDVADQLNNLFAPPGAARPAEKKEEEEEARQAYYSWLYGAPGKKEEERPISNLIGKVRVVPDTRINSLIITTAVQNFEVLRQLIKKLDEETPKVLLKVQLVEVTRIVEKRTGVRFSSDASIFETQDFNSGLLSTFGVTWEEVTTDTVLTADFDLALLVQFLQRNFDGRVLSQPSLVVNNNQEAEIFVGSDVPFLKEAFTVAGTTDRRDVFDYREVGTKLLIKPHINSKDKVVTSVQITSSQRRPGEILFGAEILDRRFYSTELAVESSQTMVVGGILRQEESEIVHKVPVLGDIPVLRFLFRKRAKALTTTELIAFVTPTVLRTRAQDDDATAQERQGLQEVDELVPSKEEPADVDGG